MTINPVYVRCGQSARDDIIDVIIHNYWGEPERDKGADGMQLFALDCIAYIVDADTDRVFACMNDM